MIKSILKTLILIILIGIILYANLADASAQNIKFVINSSKIAQDFQAKLINGVAFVPVGSVFNAMGWEVEWNGACRSAISTKEDNKIVLKAGSKEADVNGEKVLLDGTATIINSRLYVSSRFIANQLGMKIIWNKKDNLIILSNKDLSSVTINGGGNIVIAGNGIIVSIVEAYSSETVMVMLNYADRLLKANNPTEALAKYKKILENISREEDTHTYAHVMNNMGNAYSMLAEINDVRKNIFYALDKYNEALGIYEKNSDSINYGITSNNLGNAYKILWEVSGYKMYLIEARDQYEKALQSYSLEGYILDRALIQYNLGIVYEELGQGNVAKENLSKARELYEEALQGCDNEDMGVAIRYNLGNTYKVLSKLPEGISYLEKSKEAYQSVLKTKTLESYPMDYARIHKSLGDICKGLFEAGGDRDNLSKALEEYKEGLKLYTLEDRPVCYAKIQFEIGNVYTLMSGSEDIKEACKAYEEALNVFTASDYPLFNKLVTNALNRVKTTDKDD